jgi:hypothetical protein
MEKVYSHGKMEGNMKESIMKIKRKDMVHFIGLMEDNTKECGLMANNTEKEHLLQTMVSQEKVNGISERG